MLDLNKSELIETRVATLLSTINVIEEGIPLVHVLENGISVVKPTAGAANELFAGVSVGRSFTPSIVSFIERLTVPAGSPYTITLSKTLSGSALGVAVIAADGTRTVLTSGVATNATEYSIAGQVITVNSAQASKVIELSYRYAISLGEAMLKYAFNQFAPALVAIPTIGVCTTGELFTDAFDPASNWAGYTGATPLKLGNGIFTLTGSGIAIPAIVSAVPGVDSPLLGVRLQPGF